MIMSVEVLNVFKA